MSIKLEGGCAVHCDGYDRQGKKCHNLFTRPYKSREDLIAQALTVGGYTEDRRGNHYCPNCSEIPQRSVTEKLKER